jgi:hypothetical protein
MHSCPVSVSVPVSVAVVLLVAVFISRWKASGGSERANFQTFANELCEVLGLPKPAPASEATRANSYCFEHPSPSSTLAPSRAASSTFTARGTL